MTSTHNSIAAQIAEAWTRPDQLTSDDVTAIEQAVDLLDRGAERVMQPEENGEWRLNEWLKQAVLLYFRIRKMQELSSGIFQYHDKLDLKRDFAEKGVRVVPPATARYGSYLAPGVILMPSYVNIGAYVGENSMVDTWATVGSCAQIGADVHLAGGVGIGGVLEPVQAQPVVIEDGAFIGSRCIVVEGVRVGKRAVLGANTVITGSTPVIDVTGSTPVEHRGVVPEGAIVIPGNRPKDFPAGHFALPCGLIIGYRTERTDDKVALNNLLREHGAAL